MQSLLEGHEHQDQAVVVEEGAEVVEVMRTRTVGAAVQSLANGMDEFFVVVLAVDCGSGSGRLRWHRRTSRGRIVVHGTWMMCRILLLVLVLLIILMVMGLWHGHWSGHCTWRRVG